MDLSAYADLAVRLANTAVGSDKAGDEDDADISTADGLRSLLADLRYPSPRPGRGDLDAMVRLRAEFRAIFAACAAGRAAEAIERLNALLIQHPVHPQISGHDGEPWHLHLTQGGCLADRYAAGSAMGLAVVLTKIGADRLGICRGARCQRVFIDTSTNRSRRYCSCRCGSRASVTAFPARRRGEQRAPLPTAVI